MLIEAAAAWSRGRSTAAARCKHRGRPTAAAVAAAAATARSSGRGRGRSRNRLLPPEKLVDLNYLTDCTVFDAIRSTKLFTRTLRA